MLPDLPRPPIHATNTWNPIGQNLRPVPGCRLYYAHVEALSGARTYVFLGDQKHLTFVADLEQHVVVERLHDVVLRSAKLYPHQVDLLPVVRDAG
ncbi:MAG: hypothetical protein HYX52_07200 [Chloroflexi bacterium]|nr:hypothetical protein [Chloroflexota bacterium]